MVTRTLTGDDFEIVHRAFVEAFSDYVVPMQLTREQLREMLTRRGWVPELSIGVFDGETLAAFTLNGAEGDRAYDSGTGVLPSHRRRGLGRVVMEESFDILRANGFREYVLEVIESNTKAHQLYLSLGFVETRALQCWRFESSAGERAPVLDELPVITPDVQPSWQNSSASISRAKDPHVILGDEQGYSVVFPSNGDLPLLFVQPEARRRGVGTRLLRAAATEAGKPLRIINVDERDPGVARFLEAAGAQRTVRQLEMALRL